MNTGTTLQVLESCSEIQMEAKIGVWETELQTVLDAKICGHKHPLQLLLKNKLTTTID